jgi:chromosome segregation ATPase
MRFIARVALLLVLSFSALVVARAQNANASVEQLRSQLSDLQTRESQLQDRAKQLDEDLQPENIEKYFALNGSTHPEELREQRRRQLQAERDNVSNQLNQLVTSRARLEADIATAEAAAYRQSASPSSLNPPAEAGGSAASPSATSTPKSSQPRARHTRRTRRAKTKRNG